MEPFRAFVGDNLPDNQRTAGFAMQSFFIGVGSVVASMLPYILTNWFGVDNTAEEGIIPDSVKWSFYLGAAVFITTILWTVFKSKEYSPEELAAFSGGEEESKNFSLLSGEEAYAENGKKQMTTGGIVLLLGSAFTYWLYANGLEKELYVLSLGVMIVGVIFIVSGLLQQRRK